MKPREKILLIAFCALFGLIIGGGILVFSLKKYREITADNDDLRSRIELMETTIAHGEEWQSKSEWVQNNVPVFGSRQEASSRLIETIQKHRYHHRRQRIPRSGKSRGHRQPGRAAARLL
jgi:hypothetical protein